MKPHLNHRTAAHPQKAMGNPRRKSLHTWSLLGYQQSIQKLPGTKKMPPSASTHARNEIKTENLLLSKTPCERAGWCDPWYRTGQRDSSQLPITPAPGHLTPSSYLPGHYTRSTMPTQTQKYTFKNCKNLEGRSHPESVCGERLPRSLLL